MTYLFRRLSIVGLGLAIASGCPSLLAQGQPASSPQSSQPAQGNPLFQIRQNDKLGFINRSGQIVVSPQYDDSHAFSEGLAVAQLGEKYGYVNPQGQWVIKPQFELAEDFSEGLAAVMINDQLGYINASGQWVIKPQFFWWDRSQKGWRGS